MNVKDQVDWCEEQQKQVALTGDRYNNGKTRWSLIVWKALIPMIEVLEFGAKKYAPFNWTKGLKYTETCDSLLRHTHAFLEGEDNDPESKLSHVGHILANAMFLSYMFLFRKDMDDRHKINRNE
jgi:hypothetical protein